MPNDHTGLPDIYEAGVHLEAEHVELAWGLISNNIRAVRALGAGVEERPDANSFKVTASSGLSVSIAAGSGFAHHSIYGAAPLQKTTASTLSDLADNSTLYIYAAIEVVEDANDSRKTGVPQFVASESDTYDGGILLAQVTTAGGTVTGVADRRALIKTEKVARVRGAWDATTYYTANDLVLHDNSWWLALDNSLNEEPSDGLIWSAIGGGGSGGTIIRNGSGAPADALGANGDYYLDNDTDKFYYKDAGAYSEIADFTGASGTNGTNGADGSAWRSGSGAPADALGANGDFYLNTSNGAVYAKAADVYTQIANIKGPQGIAGGSLNWAGDWVTATAYSVDDAVQNGDPLSSYRCKTAHTSSATDEPGVGANWTDYWILFAESGEDGAAGTDGATWRNGSGVPSDALGVNGDFYLDTATSDVYKKTAGEYAIIANIKGDAGGVTSLNTRTGDVVLNSSDVGLGNVDNTSDANKPVSTATQAALDGKQSKSQAEPGTGSPITLYKYGSTIPDAADQGAHVASGEGFLGYLTRQLEGRGSAGNDWHVEDRLDSNDNNDGGWARRFIDSTGTIVNGLYMHYNRFEFRKPFSLHHAATLPTPIAGETVLGVKGDGKLYAKNSAGVETEIGSGGSGGGSTDEIAERRRVWLYG